MRSGTRRGRAPIPKTATPVPFSDRRSWRRLKACVHPDKGVGDHDLFLFICALEEYVREQLVETAPRGDERGSPRAPYGEEEPERIPYDPEFGDPATFVDLTCRALRVGRDAGEPYGPVLGLLASCPAHGHGRAVPRQSRGASYRQLASIGHRLGWSKGARVRWYRVCEEIPLSDAHASYLIARLGERGAA